MTRINVGYPVKKLTRQHLLSESREIKRIPNMVRTGRAKLENIPEKFKLGAGHVKFFYDKLGYLLKRYREIYKECKRRGYNVTNYESAWYDLPDALMKDYTPTQHDRKIIKQRINERLKLI